MKRYLIWVLVAVTAVAHADMVSKTVQLKNQGAKEFIAMIREAGKGLPEGASAFADSSTNTLSIWADDKQMDKILQRINEFDAPSQPCDVLIEVGRKGDKPQSMRVRTLLDKSANIMTGDQGFTVTPKAGPGGGLTTSVEYDLGDKKLLLPFAASHQTEYTFEIQQHNGAPAVLVTATDVSSKRVRKTYAPLEWFRPLVDKVLRVSIGYSPGIGGS